jgi:hypothetical protein
LGHLRSMAALAEMGAIIAPPVPAFYHHPKTIDDLVGHSVDRVLDLLGLPDGNASRWDGASKELARTTERPYQARSAEPARVSDDLEGRTGPVRTLEELAQNGVPGETVPDSSEGALGTLCASKEKP